MTRPVTNGATRATGALLAVAAAEASALPGRAGPVTAALIELSWAIAKPPGPDAFASAMARYDGIAPVAWALPLAITTPDPAILADTIAELAPRDGAAAYVAYGQIASRLMDGAPAGSAREAAPGAPAGPGGTPDATAPPAVYPHRSDDASAGYRAAWAELVTWPGGLAEYLRARPRRGPAAMAAAGLLGLHHGFEAVPHRLLPEPLDAITNCFALGTPLYKLRRHRQHLARLTA